MVKIESCKKQKLSTHHPWLDLFHILCHQRAPSMRTAMGQNGQFWVSCFDPKDPIIQNFYFCSIKYYQVWLQWCKNIDQKLLQSGWNEPLKIGHFFWNIQFLTKPGQIGQTFFWQIKVLIGTNYWYNSG